LQSDASLVERIKLAPDADGAIKIIQEAGFEIAKNDIFRYQASELLKLSDAELESMSSSQPMGSWNTWSIFICGNCS
jgi:predicted ribosomally synthesized peptide with nif11-like leader